MRPLIDLHCHVEGTVHPELLGKLAKRNSMTIPDGLIGANGNYIWDDFSEFLKAYDAVAEMVRTQDDYRDVIFDYFTRAAKEGLIYGEVFSSPDHAARFGLSYPDLTDAIVQGLKDAEAHCGVKGRIITTCVRHLGPERALQVARQAAQHQHEMIVGFGMGGEERWGNLADFASAFALARDAGLALTVHAGEICGPQSVRDALDLLRPDRIGHGVRSVEDADLVRRIADEGVVLEVCPGSNIALGIYPSYAKHPFETLRTAGCKLALGVDDPPFFNTRIGQEYEQIISTFKLSETDIQAFNLGAVDAAFCDDETKSDLRAAVRSADGQPN
jgi:adenosine deaminase